MSIAKNMEAKLKDALKPQLLEVKNISHLHAGHAGDNGTGESHFIVKIVSDAFEGQSRIARHRMIHEILSAEMEASIHALSIKAQTPSEKI